MNRLPVRRAWGDTGLLLVTAAAVYLVDRLSKAWIVANVDVGEQIPVIGDVVQVWHTENAGAAFGLLPGAGFIFAAVGVATVAVVTWVHLTGRVRGPLTSVLLGLVLGGTLGNLTDRFADGTVTDFVSVGIGSLRWPTFNVADASVVIGILGLVVVLSVLDSRAAARAA